MKSPLCNRCFFQRILARFPERIKLLPARHGPGLRLFVDEWFVMSFDHMPPSCTCRQFADVAFQTIPLERSAAACHI